MGDFGFDRPVIDWKPPVIGAAPRPSAKARAPLPFRAFVEAYNEPPAGSRPLLTYEHVPRLVGVAQRVCDTFATDEDGEPVWTWGGPGTPNYKRVLVLLAPRYFKSETFSRLLPAYFLRRFPTHHVGLASYSADLAWKLSGKARERFVRSGGVTAGDTDAKKLWATTEGGEMWAAGIDGSITGSGFHLGIMDDPMKPRHARSEAYINAFREFYPDTWYNRQEPGAAMLVVMQRLGLSDPIDFLFRREVGDECEAAPEHWHVVVCDEIKSAEPLGRWDGPQGLPETCTLEADPREVGEILAPSRFDAAQVASQQRAAGVYCAPQRQMRPGALVGDFWQDAWIGVYGTPDGDPYDELPRGATNGGRDWDTAYTKNEANSATANVESYGRPVPGRKFPDVYVTDCDWRWVEAPERLAWMERLKGPHFIEGKATGKSDVQMLKRKQLPVDEVPVQGGDKFARAADVQPVVAVEEGEPFVVYVHASVRHKLLHGERQGLLHVTKERLVKGGPDLDLNDAFVQALHRHARPRLSASDLPPVRQPW